MASTLSGSSVRAFHDPRYCTGPDLDHSWIGSHREGNYLHPSDMLKSSRNRSGGSSASFP